MKKIIISLLILAFSVNVFAQGATDAATGTTVTQESQNPGYNPNTEFFDLNPTTRVVGKWGLTAMVPLVTLAFGIKAWDWGERHSPYSHNERWFQQDTSFGGADKAGHLYAHYVTERFLYTVYDHLDSSPNEALLFSSIMACVVGLSIEVGDSYTSQYGFSVQDLIADYTGVAIGTILDKYPTADAFFGLSVQYMPTDAFKNNEHGVMRALEWVNDYSGFIYIANFKLAGFKYIGFDIPEFMRYIQLDVGYYTRHYSAYDEQEKRSRADNRRDIYYGMSINFAEVVKDMYDDDNSVACRLSQTPFRYYNIPSGPSNSKELSH